MIKKKGFNGKDLMRKKFKVLPFLVAGIIPTGLVILSGPPKAGKSWLALLLALCVVTGEAFLKYPVTQASVLLYALEDSYRRVQKRINKLGYGHKDLSGLHIEIFAQRLQATTTGAIALIEDLTAIIMANPEIKLIIIDTYQYIKTPKGHDDGYAEESTNLMILKEFADLHCITILIVHHTNKDKIQDKEADSFNKTHGSTALLSIPDTTMVLVKPDRTNNKAMLQYNGRDIESGSIDLEFDVTNCQWKKTGMSYERIQREHEEEFKAGDYRRAIVTLMDGKKELKVTAEEFKQMASDEGIELDDSGRGITSHIKQIAKNLLKHDRIRYIPPQKNPTSYNGRMGRWFRLVRIPE